MLPASMDADEGGFLTVIHKDLAVVGVGAKALALSVLLDLHHVVVASTEGSDTLSIHLWMQRVVDADVQRLGGTIGVGVHDRELVLGK